MYSTYIICIQANNKITNASVAVYKKSNYSDRCYNQITLFNNTINAPLDVIIKSPSLIAQSNYPEPS